MGKCSKAQIIKPSGSKSLPPCPKPHYIRYTSMTEKNKKHISSKMLTYVFVSNSEVSITFKLTWIQFGQPEALTQLHVEISSKAASRSSPKSFLTCMIEQTDCGLHQDHSRSLDSRISAITCVARPIPPGCLSYKRILSGIPRVS